MSDINKEELLKDVEDAFSKLIGEYLGLAEVAFRDKTNEKKWNEFRRLVLSVTNAHKRSIVVGLQGRNYYILIPKKEGK